MSKSENEANFKITEEISLSGGPAYYVYTKKAAPSGFIFGSNAWEWRLSQVFYTLEEAENHVKKVIEYMNSKKNPKLVKYY